VLKVRLTRTGRKKRPSYRVVVAEHTAPRDGRVVERLGYYDPLAEPKIFKVDEERVKHWLSQGAQPSRTVQGLLAKQGLMEPWQAKPISKRAQAKREAATAAKAAEAAAEAAPAAKAAPTAAAEAAPAAEVPAVEKPTAEKAADLPAEEAPADASGEAEASKE
jgi:small subunit ribosomal protein S16